MTGTCTIDGCKQLIVGPEVHDPTIAPADADFIEFLQFRELYLVHVLRYHQELFATANAHAADYVKTILTKFVTCSTPQPMADARHDASRLFYWVLMGDLMMQRTGAGRGVPPNVTGTQHV